jgi:hypothetical protein
MFDVVFSNWKASLVAFNLFTYPFPNDAPTLLFKSSFLPLSYTNKQVMRPKSSLIPQSSSFFGGKPASNQQNCDKVVLCTYRPSRTIEANQSEVRARRHCAHPGAGLWAFLLP